jgi:hypothetical protein
MAAGTVSGDPGGSSWRSVSVMVMVVAPVEVDGAVVAVMVMTLVAVAATVAMAVTVAMVVVVVMMVARPALVPLRGGGPGEQHQGGGDQACDAELHGMTLVVRDAARLLATR